MEPNNKNKKSELSPFSYLKENLPLIVIILFGILLTGSVWWVWALCYGIISIAGLLLYIKLVCPYCYHYADKSCHDGYHIIAARFFKPIKGKTFYNQFKKFVPLVYPIWFLPLPLALYQVAAHFSWLFLFYLIIFCMTGFIILPIVSKNHCRKCKNAPRCPRMMKNTKKTL